MSSDSLPSGRRQRRKASTEQQRRRLPAPPRDLHRLEIAFGRLVRLMDTAGLPYESCPPIGPDDVTLATRARLLRRAEARIRRVHRDESRVRRDWYWLAAELALVLPSVPSKVVLRWRERLRWHVWHAELSLKQAREFEARVLAHEPEADAWLRRQLSDLGSSRPSA
jgi:hypothetical protein